LVLIKASTWLDRHNPVEQMTWAPGLPMMVEGRLVVLGGWIERKDVTSFNLYRPPRLALGDATQAGPWIEHAKLIYPEDANHIVCWLAHRVQHPADKLNHALVLGGAQGIGKDTLIEPAKHAVGPWNFHDISPSHLTGNFNGFAKSVILRVSEARDLGDMNRFTFYDHTKIYAAAPPDVLRVNEKYLLEYYIFNVCGLIITTNYKTDGIYLPTDDRRHYVAWSYKTKEEFAKEYWNELWGWYENGGIGHVAAYLHELDLSGFDAKAPPPKTPAFWDIVGANVAPEDSELADVIDTIGHENSKEGRPETVTLAELQNAATGDDVADWLHDRKNRRSLPHRLERCGYTVIRNPDRKDGLWKLGEKRKRQVVYARADLSPEAQLAAARKRQK
jgi:hypothetical protein